MENYFYEAATSEGAVMKGTIQALNERLAVDQLQNMGYFPLSVSRERKEKALDIDLLKLFHSRVTEKDVMTFTYQLGVLLDAGFTLDKSLFVLSDLTEKKALRDFLKEIYSQVRGGKSFSEALSRFPEVFPPFYVNMVKAGETGGFLEDTVSRIAVYLENSQAIKGEIRSALIYPLFVTFVGGAAVLLLLTFVVPKFKMIFSDMGGALPLPTIMLLAVSNALTSYWWAIMLCAAGLIAYSGYFLRGDRGRQWWDNIKFRLPLFGKLYKEAAVATFARTFATLLKSGVPILNALQVVKGTLRSDRLSDVISSVRDEVKKGRGISEPLKNSDIFPPIAVHMVTVGEETGRLDEMLVKIADRFDMEVRTTVKRVLAILGPILILLLGIIIGFIVVAMLLAILSINELPF
ncbi:MAG: type II secretion system F family protein [Nitrospirae bacterium]|nr:type II secretion system F family protein [Nitrospirota bacterium]